MLVIEKTDTQLQQDVTNELEWDPSVTSDQISVAAHRGIVTLRGNVPHFFEKSTALKAAQRVGGVQGVADEIEVKIMGSYERTDEDIARAGLDALEWSYSAPKGVTVTVEKGWITLRGEVDWDHERTAAKKAVSQLMGVRGVSDELVIKAQKSHLQPGDIKDRIDEAFRRSALTEGNKIEVIVEGSRVTLNGKVNSFSEIGDAGVAAWFAPGVTSVENNLKLAH